MADDGKKIDKTWRSFFFTFKATSETEKLSIRGEINGKDADVAIDDISVVAAAVESYKIHAFDIKGAPGDSNAYWIVRMNDQPQAMAQMKDNLGDGGKIVEVVKVALGEDTYALKVANADSEKGLFLTVGDADKRRTRRGDQANTCRTENCVSFPKSSFRGEFTDEVDGTQKRIGIRGTGVDGIDVFRHWKSPNIQTHQIKVEKAKILNLVTQERRIRRIDGNHRLHLASQLAPDTQLSTKYLAPFCAILLAPPGDDNDDYVESMLFHTINSTALPLDSEHALRLILGQAPGFGQTPDQEFSMSAALHLTRLLKTPIDALPVPQKARLGTTPNTVLYASSKAILAANGLIKTDRSAMQAFATEMTGALTDILARLPATVPEFCKADFFIELAALAWQECAAGTHEERVNAAVKTLEGMARWLGRDGLHGIQDNELRSLAMQLFELFRSVRNRVPKRVFFARWYPQAIDGEELTKANLRKTGIDRALADLVGEGINLVLDDPGTQVGSTFPIHKDMYNAIARNDIILIDLSGVRPNVCVEAGYALDHHKPGRLIFMFQPTGKTENNPAQPKPPFDWNTFRYEMINDSGEIPEKLKPHIKAILEGASIGS